MSCSLAFASAVPSGTFYACNPDHADYYTSVNKASFAMEVNSYSSVALVVPMHSSIAYNQPTSTSYSYGTNVGLTPKAELWLGFGFYANPTSVTTGSLSGHHNLYQCDADVTAVAYQCPAGTLATATNDALTSPTCVAQTSVTVVSDTWQTVAFTASQAQQTVIKLDYIPFNASALIVNVTVPTSVSGVPFASAGAALIAPDAYYYGTYQYGHDPFDCGLDSAHSDRNMANSPSPTLSFVSRLPGTQATTYPWI